ncbi:hypothetical protein HYPSUDRAFT_207059 [Hypholoma sublateritium FD-334 SS-4]|uniref:Uncharacterized protein n=1 Tax=Hypholoma sublateritium (strain FD-334 SS-4) TaxID=945553 RepID=A0A0D2P7X4_HYPSF|nr:hypothetical protein HYPSUDRAFT_207059 [Hypholoma sublateritium FD-334 SS-4]
MQMEPASDHDASDPDVLESISLGQYPTRSRIRYRSQTQRSACGPAKEADSVVLLILVAAGLAILVLRDHRCLLIKSLRFSTTKHN